MYMNKLEAPTIKPKTEFLIKGDHIFESNTTYKYLGDVTDILLQEVDLKPFSVVKNAIDFSALHSLVNDKSYLVESGNKCILGVKLKGWNFKDIVTESSEDSVYFRANPQSKYAQPLTTPLNRTLTWYFDTSGEYSAWLAIIFTTNVINNKFGITNDVRFNSLYTYIYHNTASTFYRYPIYNTWTDGKFCTGENFTKVYPSIFTLFQDVMGVMQDGSWNLDLSTEGDKIFHWDENFITKNNDWASLVPYCSTGLSGNISLSLKSELHV